MRTVNSIHDFKPGQLVGFGKNTHFKYKVYYHAKGICTRGGDSTFNNGWVVNKVAKHDQEWHLCLDANESKSSEYYFVIPESELISKGIISPQPAVEEKLKSRTPEIETIYKLDLLSPELLQPEIERIYPELDAIKQERDKKIQEMIQREYINGIAVSEPTGTATIDLTKAWEESAKSSGIVESKPFILLKPRPVLVSERIKEIVSAISQVDTMQEVIPQEWLEELQELNEWLKSKRK